MRILFLCFVCVNALAADASAQRVFDEWPVRTNAGPDALLRGAEAVYWNPAAISTRAVRGEVLINDQRTPDAVGVGGFAAAAAWRLDARTTVAAGYQHVAIDDIGETSESPLPDEGVSPTFSIGEDQVFLGVAHQAAAGLSAGAGVRYDRSNELGYNQSTTSLTAGVLFVPGFSLFTAWSPAVGAAVLARRDGVRWSGGVDFAFPSVSGIAGRFGYGARGGEGLPGIEHRLGVTGTWRDLVVVTLGAMNGTGGGARVWEPTFGASLRVSRYELGVIRESLSNDFGAAYSFRLRLGID